MPTMSLPQNTRYALYSGPGGGPMLLDAVTFASENGIADQSQLFALRPGGTAWNASSRPVMITSTPPSPDRARTRSSNAEAVGALHVDTIATSAMSPRRRRLSMFHRFESLGIGGRRPDPDPSRSARL